MTDRKDSDYEDDPLAPHENQSVRRTVDDVIDINKSREFWRTAKAHTAVALKFAVAVPVALVAAIQAFLALMKLLGKAP